MPLTGQEFVDVPFVEEASNDEGGNSTMAINDLVANNGENEKGKGSNSQQEDETKAKIMKSMYRHLVSRVCTRMACNMHELIKTGEITMNQLKVTT